MKKEHSVFIEDIFEEKFQAKASEFVMPRNAFVVHCKSDYLSHSGDSCYINLFFSSDPENEHAFVGFNLWAEDQKKSPVTIQQRRQHLPDSDDKTWATLSPYFRAQINELVRQHDVQKSLKKSIAITHITDATGTVH